MIKEEIIKIPVKTYYLEMRKRNISNPIIIPEGCGLIRAYNPTIDFYRFLFISLGSEWGWTSRLLIDDKKLEEVLNNQLIEIYVFYIRGVPAGYFELNRTIDKEIELSYFGLFMQFIGKGYGKLLMNLALEKAWTYNPARIWLHTCEYDHKSALELYKKAGFEVYDEKIEYEFYPKEFLDRKNISH